MSLVFIYQLVVGTPGAIGEVGITSGRAPGATDELPPGRRYLINSSSVLIGRSNS
jgi:hypothetical protein